MAELASVTLLTNDEEHSLELDTRTSLLDLLREHLGLAGTKKGCDHGQCGACSVLIEGRRANACLVLAVAHDGAEILTIEGLARNGSLHRLQAALVEHDAFQCLPEHRRGDRSRSATSAHPTRAAPLRVSLRHAERSLWAEGRISSI